MSLLQNLFRNNLLLLLIISPVCQSAVLGDDIKQDISKGGTGVVHTGSGDIHIGITLKEYEAGLKRREKKVKAELANTHSKERKLLETKLQTIQNHLADAKQSYKTHIKNLEKRITQLESIRGQVSDKLLNQAQKALANDNSKEADKLLQQIEAQTASIIKVAAEASYQRCQIAEDDIRYRHAFTTCQRAVQLAPKRIDYLSSLAYLAYTLGQYQLAKDYYEQALASDLKSFGEDHPNVARDRNNLGEAWRQLGHYQKAIGYYEQALASDLKTFGEDHPRVAIDRNNLGEAWRQLGQLQKAIGYYEQALASDLKSFGEEHSNVATYRNNLGSAWASLGEYQKAIGYYEQALASDLKSFGEDHSNVAGDRSSLGVAWVSLGDYQKAIGYYEQALKSFEKTLGASHPSTKAVKDNLQQLRIKMQDQNKE